MKTRSTSSSIKALAETAILAALMIVLQVWCSNIRIGTVTLSVVLIPIVLGGILQGPLCGWILGLVFGGVTYFGGLLGMDPFTGTLIAEHPILTALICFGKAMAAGVGAALLYRAMRKKNETLGIWLACMAAPIINTGLFILGALFMVGDTLNSHYVVQGQTLVYFVVIVCAGVNFIAEFLINLVCAPVISRLSRLRQQKKI